MSEARLPIQGSHPTYANTKVTFLEVKMRDVYGKTAKHRIVRGASVGCPMDDAERQFLHLHLGGHRIHAFARAGKPV